MKLDELNLQYSKLSYKKDGEERIGFTTNVVWFPESISYDIQPLYEEFRIKNLMVIKNFNTLEIKQGKKIVAKKDLDRVYKTVHIDNNYVSDSITKPFTEYAYSYISSALKSVSIYEYIREQLAKLPDTKFENLTEEQKELFNKLYGIKSNLDTLLSNGNAFVLDDEMLQKVDPTGFLNAEEINKFIEEEYKDAEQFLEKENRRLEAIKKEEEELEKRREEEKKIKQDKKQAKKEEKRKKREEFIQKAHGIAKKAGDIIHYCAKPLTDLTSKIKDSVNSAKEKRYAKKKKIEAELKYKKRTELNK